MMLVNMTCMTMKASRPLLQGNDCFLLLFSNDAVVVNVIEVIAELPKVSYNLRQWPYGFTLPSKDDLLLQSNKSFIYFLGMKHETNRFKRISEIENQKEQSEEIKPLKQGRPSH